MDWLNKKIGGASQNEAAEVKKFVSQRTWPYIDALGQHLEHAEQTKYTKEQRHEIAARAIKDGKREDLLSAAALTTKHSTLLKEVMQTVKADSDDREVGEIERFAKDMKFVAKHEKALQTARDNYHPEVGAPEIDPANVKKALEHIKEAREYQQERRKYYGDTGNSNGSAVATTWKPALPTAFAQTQQTTPSQNASRTSQDDILQQNHSAQEATTKKPDDSPKQERKFTK
jgi:hypothetical protein